MAGKKPHLEFGQRADLDGSEELYTQNANYSPTEQKFTLAQVKEWILKDELSEHTEVIIANQEDQRSFQLAQEVLLPYLSEVHFEKCKLTYNQDYIIRNDKLIYTSEGFQICEGERLEVRYFFKTNTTQT